MKVAEYNELHLGGRDFLYLKEENLMFVAMSDMNITSRLDAYLTNVTKSIAIQHYYVVFIPLGFKIKLNRQLRGCRCITGV